MLNMSKDKAQVFYLLKPCLLVSYVLGFFPYKIDERRVLMYQRYYDYVQYGKFIVIYIISPWNYVQFNYFQASNLELVVHLVFVCANYLSTLLICVLTKFHQTKFKLVCEELSRVNEKMKIHRQDVINTKIRFTGILLWLSEFLTTFVFSIMSCIGLYIENPRNVTVWDKIFAFGSSYLINIIHVYTTLTFNSFFITLNELFVQINNNFDSKISKLSKNETITLIYETSKHHESLCEVGRKLNSCVSFQLLITYALYFILFTSNLLFVVVNMMNGNFSVYVCTSFFWIMVCVFKTVCTVRIASKFMETVSI